MMRTRVLSAALVTMLAFAPSQGLAKRPDRGGGSSQGDKDDDGGKGGDKEDDGGKGDGSGRGGDKAEGDARPTRPPEQPNTMTRPDAHPERAGDTVPVQRPEWSVPADERRYDPAGRWDDARWSGTVPVGPEQGQHDRPHAQSHSAVTREKLQPRPPVRDATRRFDASTSPPPDQSEHPREHADPRYHHPHPGHFGESHQAGHPPPRSHGYQCWYSHWWIHPYYRHYHITWVVVGFPFDPYPWATWWSPPPRAGWVWVPGYWSYGHWVPGHWRPTRQTYVHYGVTYVYVPGWWSGEVYVEGYWRPAYHPNSGWVWVDGYYLADGSYYRGHWLPSDGGPSGYVWEPGFFDGEAWVEGFWRPRYHAGFVWISSWYGGDGVYHAGYWEPVNDRPGQVWIPGWFDGTRWIDGYWVTETVYRSARPDEWEPDEEPLSPSPEVAADDETVPLALPVDTAASDEP